MKNYAINFEYYDVTTGITLNDDFEICEGDFSDFLFWIEQEGITNYKILDIY